MATPEKKFSTGAISATIWKNEQVKDGKNFSYYTVTIDRRYKDRDDQWKSTSSVRANDLPKVELVARKAFEYLMLEAKSEGATSEGAPKPMNIVEEKIG